MTSEIDTGEYIAGSKRLIYVEAKKRPIIIISLRVATGQQGWLWWLVDEPSDWRHFVVAGLHILHSAHTRGFQLLIGPFNFLVAWAKRGS